MPISGTLLNVVTVLIGGTLGLIVGGRLPERFNDIIMGGLGLCTILIGLQSALLTGNVLILMGSILLGGIVGEILRLDYRLDRLGDDARGADTSWSHDYGHMADAHRGRQQADGSGGERPGVIHRPRLPPTSDERAPRNSTRPYPRSPR